MLYDTHCHSDPLGSSFVLLSAGTFGRPDKPDVALLNEQAEFAWVGGGVVKDGFVVNTLRELSVWLCRGNYVLYKRRVHALARATVMLSIQVLIFPRAYLYFQVCSHLSIFSFHLNQLFLASP